MTPSRIRLGILILLFISSVSFPQDSADSDFSDLDKVEKEEFGGENQGADTGDFDLSVDSKKGAGDNVDAIDDLDKEMDAADGKKAQPKPEGETVDLDKELQDGLEEDKKEQAGQPEGAPQETTPLPPLEAPQEEQAQTPPEPAQPEQPTQAAETKVPEIADEPNAALEARYNRIYQKFMSERTTDEQWAQIAGAKAAESYSVQQGDTLWDISVTLFGNGHFWPKIWQLNDDITNPHVIKPGRVIKFTPGNLEQAPQMEVTEGGEESAEPEQTVAEAETVETAETPEEEAIKSAPKPSRPTKPALKEIPPSLPSIVYEGDGNYDEQGFSLEKQKADIGEAQVSLTSYLSETEPVGIGEVTGVEMLGANTAAVYQYVFVKMQSATIGQNYTVISSRAKVEYDGDKYGVPVDYEGELKITEKVNDQENVYKALVTKSLGQISIGCKIVPEKIPTYTVGRDGRAGSARGMIVGGDYDHSRKVFGDGQIVYMNSGANQGVAVGDILAIISNDTERNDGSNVTRNTRQIGSVKVIKTTPLRSTGVVIKSSDTVIAGDLVGAPVSQNGAAASAEDSIGGASSGGDSFDADVVDEPAAPSGSDTGAKPNEEMLDEPLEL